MRPVSKYPPIEKGTFEYSFYLMLMAVLGFMFGFASGSDNYRSGKTQKIQQEAIELGFAKTEVVYGVSVFVWNNPSNPSK